MSTTNIRQRPDKQQPASLSFDSQAVHAGNIVDATTGAIRTPIVMANSYQLPDDPSALDWSDSRGLFYTRNSGHNQRCLERKLAAMERGEEAAVFSTGVAALHSIFFTFLKSGDHVIVSDVTFTPPPMFRGLEHGVDFVVHALTKYINGHGDAMGGAVIGSAELIHRLKGDALVDVGAA